MLKRLSLTAAIFTAATAPAFAHLDPVEHGSFMAGVSHPLFGMDHILVMVAVGLWAAQIAREDRNNKALWAVPSAFVGTMAVGFVLALAGVALPFVEPAILASVIALGLLVAMAVHLPTVVGAVIVGLFALFHGHAHGGELGSAGALQFGLGFVAATTLLHMAGIALGLGISRFAPNLTRMLGGLTALAGLSLVFG
ncbi:HupE/UreJ family protein [Neorhizobium petrolearium]|uniref:HupE/UreJ family protein n=1 Tax=Neorhizobium petrolearium TaxID=515361 RepID=A0ABY8MAP3_9HYPH|nr:HupE/UreJ family protein [Neorhizobium petrolearium]MCC2610713.1 HupE/UreJ family protein [Neorhizobium petrolearium]WGI70839.1 HupE/UreJ family protein [Neorhizobium petrolearium]